MHFGFDLAPDVFGILYDDSGKENNLSMAPVSGGIGPPKWDYGYGINGGGLLFSSDPNHTNYAQSSKMGWLSPRGSVSIWLKAGISGNKVGIPFCVSNGFAQGKTEFAISTDLMTKTVSIWLMIDGLTRWMASTSPGTLAESAWTQVVVTHDGSKPRIYVNGVGLPLEFSQSNDLTAWMSSLGLASSPATKFYVGGAPRYYSPLMAVGFSGQVDELTVWDQPLSGSTIYELFSEMDSLSSQSFSSASSGA